MRERVKAKKTIIIIAVLVLIIGIGTGCALWMRTSGIHFLFGFMRADVKEKCYLYNPKEDKFLGQKEVVIKGGGNGVTKKFNGEISVDGYEIEGDSVNDSPMERNDSVCMTTYAGITGAMEKKEEGTEYWKSQVSERIYTVYVDVKNSDDFSICVGEAEEPLYVVHAASEEKAREVFQKVVLQGKENVVWD